MKKQIYILKSFFLFILFFSLVSPSFAAPIPVSPVLENGIAVSASCRPTFSWAAVLDSDDCDSYEIAVFAFPNENDLSVTAEELFADAQPIIEAVIPAPAQSWTPGRETTGLEAGRIYIWFIRSQVYDDDSGKWSAGAGFTVDGTEILTILNQAVEQQFTLKFEQTDFSKNYFDPNISFDKPLLLPMFAEGNNIADGLYRQESSVNSGTRSASELTGTNNVIYGWDAGSSLVTSGDDQGVSNTLFGCFAGTSTSSGDANTFVGNSSGHSNQTGSSNVAIGGNAGFSNETKDDNVYVGYRAGYIDKGFRNTIIGSRAGKQNINGDTTTANNNTFLGFHSGQSNYGYNNTFIGSESGTSIASGRGNVFIGFQAGSSVSGENDKLYIANSSTSSPLIYGEFDNALLRVNGTLEFSSAYATSDKRWKKDIKPLPEALSQVRRLNGVSYFWRRSEFPEKGFQEGRRIGLIAQEVEKVLPEVVNTDSQGYKSVAYSNIVPVLIEALKKQQEIIEKQNQAIERQNRTLTTQGQAIAELQRLVKK